MGNAPVIEKKEDLANQGAKQSLEKEGEEYVILHVDKIEPTEKKKKVKVEVKVEVQKVEKETQTETSKEYEDFKEFKEREAFIFRKWIKKGWEPPRQN